jgi:tetratricopeptide (TPR) repeat protein
MGPPALYSRTVLSWALAERGRFSEALDHATDALGMARELGRPYTVAFACLGPGLVHLRQGDPIKAVPFLKEGHDLLGEGRELRVWLPVIAADFGYAQAWAGARAEGLCLLDRAAELALELRVMARYPLTLVYLAEAHLLAGNQAEAHAWAGRAHQAARRQGERGHEAWALRLLGDLSAEDASTVGQAEREYGEALTLARELGMRPLEMHCHVGIGVLHRRMGRLEAARAELQAALEGYGAMGMTTWRAGAEAELARLA